MNEDYSRPSPVVAGLLSWGGLLLAVGLFWLARSEPSEGQLAVETPAQVVTPALTSTNDPRSLKFTLTLSEPEDLKVRQGDGVNAGDVLADRTRQRERLQAQRQRTELSLEQIKGQRVSEPPPPRPVPPMAQLPAVSYATEEAKIAEVQDRIDLQTRKLDLLGTLPPDQVTPAMREHEDRILEGLYRDLEEAQAGLKTAQEARAYQEYEYSLAVAQRTEQANEQRLSYSEQLQRTEEQRRNRAFQAAQLEAQLQDIDNQLADLSTVRSPYSGTIRRIKWLGQSDNRLSVEITLAVAAGAGGQPGIVVSPGDGAGLQ